MLLSVAAFTEGFAVFVGIFPRQTPAQICLVMNLKNYAVASRSKASDTPAVVQLDRAFSEMEPFGMTVEVHRGVQLPLAMRYHF